MKKMLKFFVLAVVAVLLPNSVLAEEDYLAKFNALLNENGDLEIESIPPTDEESFYFLVNEYVGEVTSAEVYFDSNSCNKDYTVCDVVWGYDGNNYQYRKEINIIYNYDVETKKVIQGYVDNLPENIDSYEVKDMELINWWVNSGEIDTLVNYSGELKQYLNHKNFSIDARMGDDAPLYTFAEGFGLFKYNDVVYAIKPHLSVETNHIIYVPETTGDTKEELMAAVNKRIENYIGKGKATITYGGNTMYELTINYYDKMISDFQRQLEEELSKPVEEQNQDNLMSLSGTLENFKNDKQDYIDNYDPNEELDENLAKGVGNHFFILTIGERKYNFVVVKSDEDMVVPTYKTSDIGTDVSISSSSSSIPLDTLIQANKLTSGSTYDDLMKLLNVTNSETFDLKLYSNTLEDYITKLDNGTFEVRIPLSEKLKDEDLIVYYVDKNNEIEEHEVKKEDGYAVFMTNHFSIYTLAETSGNSEITNPPTYDGITIYYILGGISLLGLIIVGLYTKKKIFN